MAQLDMSKYCKLDEVEESLTRKCKIVCTMGPNQSSPEAIVGLLKAGMDIARMNFSHGDHETHGAMVARIREAAKMANKSVAIALDTKGPEIRTGFFKEAGSKIKLTKGQDLKLAMRQASR
jgi:pyruvate kinase